MISRIEGFHYRCFDRLDLGVESYHVLAGPNGSGKSTLLDIPLLLGDMVSRGIVAAFSKRLGSRAVPVRRIFRSLCIVIAGIISPLPLKPYCQKTS
jgi:predicted ATPase